MVTSFGKFLRKIRIDHNEILKDMANVLGVTASFLSAVENGKKKIPDQWLQILGDVYNLTPKEIEELDFAFSETNNSIKILFDGLGEENKKVAFSFARKLDTFTEKELAEFRKIMKMED